MELVGKKIGQKLAKSALSHISSILQPASYKEHIKLKSWLVLTADFTVLRRFLPSSAAEDPQLVASLSQQAKTFQSHR